MIKATTDFNGVYKVLGKLTQNQGQNLWYKVAVAVFSKIIRNTQLGKDVDGKAFTPYSMGYKRYRTKSGLGLNVNLQKSSRMLQSLTIEADKDGFVLYITGQDNQQKATWVQDYGRIFLDWGKDTLDTFQRAVVREVQRVFEGVQ